MNDTFDICLEHFHITYCKCILLGFLCDTQCYTPCLCAATYKVQRVNVSGDREKMLQCYFIQGATDKQCFVEVYQNGKFEEPYSDFDKYKIRIPEPGNYTIKVYDNKEQARQADQGIQPANETSFSELTLHFEFVLYSHAFCHRTVISEENNKRQDTSFIGIYIQVEKSFL